MINKFKINNFLIEKIAFNDTKDYYKIIKKFKTLESNIYINYTRNYTPAYMKLAKEIDQNKPVSIEVFGQNWNLASNSFHYLSLFSFFIGKKNVFIKNAKLSKPFKSKRNGFFEFNGFLEIKTNDDDVLTLSDQGSYKNNEYIIIKNNFKIYIIFEKHKKIVKINLKNGRENKYENFNVLPQSKMTLKLIGINRSKVKYNDLYLNYENDIVLLDFFKNTFKKYNKNLIKVPIT